MCYRHPQTSDQHFYGFKLGVSQTEKKKIKAIQKKIAPMDSMDLTLMISDVSPKFVVFTTKPWGSPPHPQRAFLERSLMGMKTQRCVP